jgi:hypothetical protein
MADKAIFEESHLIDRPSGRWSGYAIMVDKGFLIDKIAAENFIKIIRIAV